MKIDDTVRVEMSDDDIREAIEQYVRIKLSTGPDTAKLKLTKLHVFDTSAALVGEEREPISYGLEAKVEFNPEPVPVKRSVADMAKMHLPNDEGFKRRFDPLTAKLGEPASEKIG